jgi:hypothetical protein
MQTSTSDDFKVDAKLIDKEDAKISFTIVRKEQEGIWIGRGRAGDKCVFECESSGYWIDQ